MPNFSHRAYCFVVCLFLVTLRIVYKSCMVCIVCYRHLKLLAMFQTPRATRSGSTESGAHFSEALLTIPRWPWNATSGVGLQEIWETSATDADEQKSDIFGIQSVFDFFLVCSTSETKSLHNINFVCKCSKNVNQWEAITWWLISIDATVSA